ncbi:ion transporter [Candidatus Stoquefichus massiliensis]|uniref:ion transporter n=1 Tax=Candidatus Stoquefichus massiliensis TaxID=1470350 RepID=UPI000487E896|nr:ion transporter [Candidatus Stoquefichus massiliensis]
MRKRIYEIIEVADENDRLSRIYDIIMMSTIFVSLIPLAFKEELLIFNYIEFISVTIFIIDYVLRWITADYKRGKNNIIAFIQYPFTIMAIVDLFSILPSISLFNSSLKVLRVIRLFRTFRIFRIFKAVRYSRSIHIIKDVIQNSKESLIAVGVLAIVYILISALIIINIEPDSFNNYFDAIYWATVSLTTVGYGDIYPVTSLGKVITMLSSFFGIAIIALPSGIITAGFMESINSK